MNLRPLGRTGLTVSEIGFGTWGIGGANREAVAYGPTDDARSRRVLSMALERGITFYDTAPLYGYGHSERLIGEAFRGRRDQVIIASKVGMLDAQARQDFSLGRIGGSLEESLERLQTDHVDLLQLHDPSMAHLERNPEILDLLHGFRREGKARAIGITLRSPEDGFQAVERWGFDSLQVNLNLLDQRAVDNGLLEFCRQRGVGVVARTPLCFGFLTGACRAEDPFHPQDHRSRWPLEQRRLWAEAPALFDRAAPRGEGETLAQRALRFCLSYPAVSSVIPGFLTESELEENLKAGELGPLPEEERRRLEQVYRENNFFLGKKRVLLSG